MKKQTTLIVLGILIGILSMSNLNAISGRDIMLKVDNRDDGNDRSSEMKMILTNKRGRTRIREIKSYNKDYGKDSKKAMVFLKPADVKGTGFLSWEYDNESKEDDRWLYMPALRKTRRISGSSDDDYFMGSDFTYDDMGDRNVDEDTHELIREENYQGYDCWVIKSIPKSEKDFYNEKILWVRKDIDMILKIEYYDKIGLFKTLNINNIEEIQGIWTAKEMVMENKREKHQTKLIFENIKYNQNLKDNIFTTSTIQRGRL